MNLVFLAGKLRQLKIHQPVVANIGDKIRAATSPQLRSTGRTGHTHHLRVISRRRRQKIQNRLPDLAPTIRVGHKIHIPSAMLEYAALKNLAFRLLPTSDPLPVGAAGKKCLHAKRRAPVQVVFRIFPVPEFRRDWNDALTLIVGQRDKHVNRAQRRRILSRRST
jgi:hypothetical protein